MNPHDWSSRIQDLVRREHGALADLLLALAEFDALSVYRRLGYPSLFVYLHRCTGLSKGAASYKVCAARLVRRFPEVVEPLRDGRLCITNVIQLSKVMTEDNRAETLPKFFHRSRQEAKELVAEIKPMEKVPERTVVTVERTVGSAAEPRPTHPERVQIEPPRTLVEPMTATLSRIHLTASRDFLALLKKAKAGQSHVQPNATDEQVLTAALELLVEKQEKRRASVAARVKREVRVRDGGKCQWPLASGGICGSEVRVEIDHIQPRGKGGPSTVANCRILCKPHNLEAARNTYGDEVMDRYSRGTGVREDCAAYSVAGAVSGDISRNRVAFSTTSRPT